MSTKIRNTTQGRYEILDQMFQREHRAVLNGGFLSLVNGNLERGGLNSISKFQLDKDISAYRKKLKEHNKINKTKIELILNYHTKDFYYSELEFSLFKTIVTDEEKELLIWANNLFKIFKWEPLEKKFSTTVNKVLAESLSGGTVEGLSESNIIQLETGFGGAGNQWIPKLLKAIIGRECLEMQYKGLGKEEKKKHICPYVLKQFRGRWFMVAYDHNCIRKEKTNVFSLDGIINLDVCATKWKYIVDDNFNAANYFSYSLGIWHSHDKEPIEVKLEFSSHIEMIQLSPLHHSQKASISKDGKKLAVEIKVYDTPELESMIMSFGTAVKVKSPDTLAKTIAESAKRVVSLY